MDSAQSWADQVMAEEEHQLGPQWPAQISTPTDQDGFTLVQKRKPKRLPPPSVPLKKAPAHKGRDQPQKREAKPKTQVVLDPRPIPPLTICLDRDSNIIYELIREHHPFGGITARKIYKILADKHYISDCSGEEMSLQDIGDILYDELKIKKIVYPVGEKGPKWRLLL